MISFIKGTIISMDEEGLVIDNHGIGYRLLTPTTVTEKVRIGEEVMIHTHFHVSENSVSMFGFSSKAEHDLFLKLISINGISPRGSLPILSTLSISDLYYAVFSDDIKTISKAPGVGPKIAKRIILELKDKLKMEDLTGELPTEEISSVVSAVNSNTISDTIEAMTALGYSNGEAYRAVHAVKGGADMDPESLLKEALKVILTLR